MARDHPALELELLPLDEGDEDGESEPAADRGGGRGWALVVGGLAAVLAVAALIGRADVPERAEPPPRPPAPTGRPSGRVPTTVPPAVAVATADRTGVLVSGPAWSAMIEVDPSLGEVTSAAAGQGFVVAVLSDGEAYLWTRARREALSVGSAEVVLANGRDDAVVWLVSGLGDQETVRTVVAPDERGSRAIPVPHGWRVVGANGQGLVLTGEVAGLGVAVWEPWDGDEPEVLDPQGSFLASSARRIAWQRDGELVETGRPYRGERTFAIEERLVGASYGPDGVRLALVEGPDDDATKVRFLEDDGTIDEGFVVRAPEISTFGWTADGDFLADPGGAVEYRYDPNWGLTISDRRLMG